MTNNVRTDEEIFERIESVANVDWLGTQRNDLIAVLPFESARQFLKDDATKEDWGDPLPRDRSSVLARMLDYMPFAWDKANNERGISAGRSMDHFTSWAWLIGEDFGELGNYTEYGKPHLRAICERFGWDYSEWAKG